MKDKLFIAFASLIIISNSRCQLEATSATPQVLVVAMQKFNGNGIILSTNTISVGVDASISTSGTEQQLIGYVEWNMTKLATSAQGMVLNQVEEYTEANGGPPAGYFAGLIPTKGNLTSSSDLVTTQAIKVYTNIDTTTTKSAIYIKNIQLVSVAESNQRSANITTATLDTFSGLIGILSFYVVDETSNSTDPGTYTGNFLFTLQTQ